MRVSVGVFTCVCVCVCMYVYVLLFIYLLTIYICHPFVSYSIVLVTVFYLVLACSGLTK